MSGELTVAKDGNTPSLVYYRLDAADALGRELTVTLGNGLHEYRDYDGASGDLSSIQTDPGLGSSIQNLSFTYDEVGNVLSRTNAKIGKSETFTYDDLNRLSTMQVGGLSSVTMAYSAAGRITSRTDLGSYSYSGGCGGGPMAVKSAAGKSYCYDASGRMTSRGGSAITWFSYDLPKKINNGTASTEFTYGVDRARITQTRKTGSTTNATITYIGDLVEREVAGSTTTWRHYVTARGRVVAQVNRVNTTNTAQYLHRDHQDSVVDVTSSTGAIVQSLAFDAWGLRRNASNWAPLASPFGGTQPTKRGYTGHEHLDNVELVNMNGRVQDPRIGVFISADPFVQAPYNSQSHNRYSYVWNNPASHEDPSGFWLDDCGFSPLGEYARLGGCGWVHFGNATAIAVVPAVDMFTPTFANGPQIARAGGIAVADAVMAAFQAQAAQQGAPTIAQPGKNDPVNVVIADPWMFPQGYQRPTGPVNAPTPAEIKANPYARGKPSKADRQEIQAILGNPTMNAAAVELYGASDTVDGELGVLRVHERNGVYYVYSAGDVLKDPNGTPYGVTPRPVDPTLGRHVVDIHPHPGESPTPSGYFRNGRPQADLAVARAQGVPGAIIYGANKHGQGRYSIYESECKKSAVKAGTC